MVDFAEINQLTFDLMLSNDLDYLVDVDGRPFRDQSINF